VYVCVVLLYVFLEEFPIRLDAAMIIFMCIKITNTQREKERDGDNCDADEDTTTMTTVALL